MIPREKVNAPTEQEITFPETSYPSEKERNYIFDKFSPKNEEEGGLIFSTTYVGYTTGIFFKKYYVLRMVTGDTMSKYSCTVEDWCDKFYKLKNKSDMIDFLKQMKKLAYERKTCRVSFETSFGVPL